MGCPKITYHQVQEGLEKSVITVLRRLEPKKTTLKKRYSYSPFGLAFNSWKRSGSLKNKLNTFQDQEKIEDHDLGWVQFKWRNHMPEIGRFFNIDPLAEKYVYNSPYAFSENKVVAHVELEGLEAQPAGKGNSAGTAFVYYVGGDNFDLFGLGGHTTLGYYGDRNYENSTTLYLPLQGQRHGVYYRKQGNSYYNNNGDFIENAFPSASELTTIKAYLDDGEIVDRYHYSFSDSEMRKFGNNTILKNRSGNFAYSGFGWCTSESKQLIEFTFGKEAANRLIYYSLPEELSQQEILETGSTRYDRFYKLEDKYYHDLWLYQAESWLKHTFEITDFDKYFSTESEY